MKKRCTLILLAVVLLGMVLIFSGCISPNQSPIAAFTFSLGASWPSYCTVDFDASSSADPDGTIVQYAWDFGGGATGSGVAPTHTYMVIPLPCPPGGAMYRVTLTVTDNDGATATTFQDITVSDRGSDNDDSESDNQAPIAEFSASALRPAATLPVDFDASASSDPDGTIVQYAWSFGDGTTGSGVTTTHVFQNETTDQIIPYTVTLTVTDNDGTSDSASVEINVTPPPPGAPGGDE